MTDARLAPTARIAGIVFAALLGLTLVAALAAGAWIGVRGLLAYTHLRDAQSTAGSVAQSLSDPTQAATLISTLSHDTSAARSLTSDPVWQLAEGVPWIGPQLAAVSTVSAALDSIASDAIHPLVEAASTMSVDSFRPIDGRIDTATFTAVQDAAVTGADGIAQAAASVDAIDRTVLVGPLRDAVDEVSTLIGATRTTTDAFARSTVLLPRMLGADGPRNYLILFQNNAEWRSLGGISGATALIHTEDGAISLTGQKSASAIGKFPESVLPLDDEVRAIYGERPGMWMHNTTLVPDFAVGAALARDMWRRDTGLEVDGVLSIDPVALSYLLAATGPVTLPTGDVLTSDNAVQLLLNDVYLRYENPRDHDLFFAAATASVFEAFKSGSADPAALVQGLARAGDEHRLLLWSAHEEDQSVLEGTSLAGELPVTNADASRFGVYVNDGTGSKMDYYLTADAAVTWDECTTDASGRASGDATLTVTIASSAPANVASFPLWVHGGGLFGVPPGTARTVSYIYLPEGFELTGSQVTPEVGFGGGTHEGRRVLSFTVDLVPGETATATVSARTSTPGAATLEVEHTPTIAPWTTTPAVCGS